MPSIGERLKNAWSAFTDTTYTNYNSFQTFGSGSAFRPDTHHLIRGGERTILNSIITRISIDVSSVPIQHAIVDQNGSFLETVDDDLNYCLTQEANIDQTAREFRRSAISIMLDTGHVAIVPVVTNIDPTQSSSYEVKTMRAGTVKVWYPRHVTVDLYNDRTGKHQDVTLPKSVVAIAINPFYSVMNEPNSTLQRLKRKLVLLDAVDEQSGSGKLDMIIQLPYALKTEGRRQQAEIRRKDIEGQLEGSKFGIAYIDSTEHITQLNRPLENNLMKQVEYLTEELYGQLGLTEEIINGTATEQVMLNYNNRTVEPILSAFVDAQKTTFLTKNARSRGHSIVFYRDPFRLATTGQLAEMADKFIRSEIASPNEYRAKALGWAPVNDSRADELRNRNLNQAADAAPGPMTGDRENSESETPEDKLS